MQQSVYRLTVSLLTVVRKLPDSRRWSRRCPVVVAHDVRMIGAKCRLL